MKTINIIYLVLLIALVSCEDVINVNLNDSSPKIVIEGNLNNRNDSVKVSVSRTTNYFNPSLNTAVTGATVIINDNHGHNYNLKEYLPGQYFNIFAGTSGYTYTLSVTTGNETYSATSTMPYPVAIDSLWINQQSNGRQKTDVINCQVHDPKNIPNYYDINIIQGDSLLNNNNRFLIYSDKYFDGLYNTFTISARRLGIGNNFTSQSTLILELLNIDQQTYDYLKELRSILDQSVLSASTPANPTNNISNGGLGYFSASSISERSIVVK
jgi:hypothetical protein